MYGDITRDTFVRARHYARVLQQQGRVGLDADPNEQTAILLHYLRSLARDLFGPAWGPIEGAGFDITFSGTVGDFDIGAGHYYVDGILCECEKACTYRTQPDYPARGGAAVPKDLPYLVYLDVWERRVTCIEDDNIREVALKGPDTATRAQVVWQVKAAGLDLTNSDCDTMKPSWDKLVGQWQAPSLRGELAAKVEEQQASTDPCTISPKSAYRGAENQLYRVEIHRGGQASGVERATFKYSRDNGSVCLPLRSLSGNEAEVGTLGQDDRHRLRIGDWVEVVYDEVVLWGEAPAYLAKVVQVDEIAGRVVLAPKRDDAVLPVYPAPAGEPVTHPFLRRWDHRERQRGVATTTPADDGALVLEEGQWLTLEDGVQAKFMKPVGAEANVYRSGDYWLIPARVATGDVEWPRDASGPIARAPDGIEHHYAKLAVMQPGNTPKSCRNVLKE